MYRCRINTEEYQIDKTVTELRDIIKQKYMQALDGWYENDKSERDLKWTLEYLSDTTVRDTAYMEYGKWRKRRSRTITYRVEEINSEVTTPVRFYGINKQIDTEKVLNVLAECGSIVIPLDSLYDTSSEEYARLQGCYLEIVKD